MSNSRLLRSLFRYKAWANEELITALRKLDSDALEKQQCAPIRILNHTYVVDRIFAAHLQGTQHGYTQTNTSETPTLDELCAAIQSSDAGYIDYVTKLSPAALEESIDFTFTDGSAGRMTREEMLAHIITHGAYHRGAIGRFLVNESIAPPRDVFTGYLHKVEPVRRMR